MVKHAAIFSSKYFGGAKTKIMKVQFTVKWRNRVLNDYFLLCASTGQASWSLWKWTAAVYVEEIQIHTCSLCDSLFITRWFIFFFLILWISQGNAKPNFYLSCEGLKCVCFPRKQLLINEAEGNMYIGFVFPNYVVYIMPDVIESNIFVWKYKRLKAQEGVLVISFHSIHSNQLFRLKHRVRESVRVCEQTQFYNLGRI